MNPIAKLRRYQRITHGWTLKRFANALGYSPSYVKALERKNRRMTPQVEAALRKFEKNEAWVAKEIKDADAEMLDWLVTALEQRRRELTRPLKRRLQKLIDKE